MLSIKVFVIYCLFFLPGNFQQVRCSLVMKRLYEDLFTDYNRLILPVTSNKTKVTVNLGLKLGQILDFNLKQQILSTNVWVEQTWLDQRLEWNPDDYDGIKMIHVPAENIWIPDIVLFNNADGNYELTLVAKAVLYANGTVVWKPPTMFRSTCEVDVEYFPFDIQTCFLRFGSWTYAGDEVEIHHVGKKRKVDIGIDLSQFYKNVEWDIIDVPAYYNEVYYECCSEPYPDVTFKIVIRRKMLFYLVNLILPVALMTFMTVSVFYLPSDSNEKVTLSISILTSLIVFFLLMLEIIPPTSLAVPLFGKYLLFTLVLVSLSACVSVYVLNIHHRSPSVHQMSPRMRQIFLKTLPRLLRLDRPDPCERSSLNRFRKKKIAQQMLQARQQNKVYDLAQPLAASLNLIETLHKSYDFNPKDDQNNNNNNGQEDEGRYFRRYIDNYISQMQRQTNQTTLNNDLNHQKKQLNNHVQAQQKPINCNCQVRTTTRGRREQPATCCEHNKCCSRAHQPLRQQSSTLSSSCQHQNNPMAGYQVTKSRLGASSCCGNAFDWTTGSSGDTMNPLMGPVNQHYSATHLNNKTNRFGPVQDDTLDMTFDYEDQDVNNNQRGNFLRPPPLARMAGSAVIGAQQAVASIRQQAAEDDLPSPPPPPRQLTKLSDSMRDLNGRLSSCSLQKMSTTSRAALAAGISSSSNGGEEDDDDDEEEEDDDSKNNDHLVDKLINSINLINNASDDIDSSATSCNNDNVTGPLGGQTQHHRHGPSISPLAFDSSFEDTPATHQADDNKCICNSSSPMQAHSHIKQQYQQQQQQQQPSFHRHYGPLDAGQMLGQQNQQFPNVDMNNTGTPIDVNQIKRPSELLLSLRLPYDQMPAHVRAAIRSILFIADSIKNEDDENSAIEDWESMSMVVDRLFLWIFFLLCTFGSIIILALAPSLYDQRDSIDDKLRIEIPPSNCSALS